MFLVISSLPPILNRYLHESGYIDLKLRGSII